MQPNQSGIFEDSIATDTDMSYFEGSRHYHSVSAVADFISGGAQATAYPTNCQGIFSSASVSKGTGLVNHSSPSYHADNHNGPYDTDRLELGALHVGDFAYLDTSTRTGIFFCYANGAKQTVNIGSLNWIIIGILPKVVPINIILLRE